MMFRTCTLDLPVMKMDMNCTMWRLSSLESDQAWWLLNGEWCVSRRNKGGLQQVTNTIHGHEGNRISLPQDAEEQDND
jgi:hypothetical protein